MTATQRVDVARLSVSVERFGVACKFSDDDGAPEAYMCWQPNGEYVRHSDYAALLQQLAEAERAREEAEQDRWRTDWPEMTPVSNAHPSIWKSERVIVSLVGGRVTHDVAESFDGQRPLWFIHRDKVRAWQPFPAAFRAANGGE